MVEMLCKASMMALIAFSALSNAAAAKETPKQIAMLDTGGHMAKVQDIVFTPDGRQLVSASDDKTIRVWDLVTGTVVRTIRGESSRGRLGKIFAMALSPDGNTLAAAGDLCPAEECKQGIRLYDFASGTMLALLKGHDRTINRLAFSPDGKKLISGSNDNTAIIWDVLARKSLHHLSKHKAEVYAVAFTPDGMRAVTGSYDRDLRLWRVADGEEVAYMPGHADGVRSIAIAPNGTVASGDRAGEIRLWDSQTGRLLRKINNRNSSIGVLQFSPDGSRLLTTCVKCSENVLDINTKKIVSKYNGHYVNLAVAGAFSSGGELVATGGADGEIHLWHANSGKIKYRLVGKELPVDTVAFSCDGKNIVWGGKPTLTARTNENWWFDVRGDPEFSFSIAEDFGSIKKLSKKKNKYCREGKFSSDLFFMTRFNANGFNKIGVFRTGKVDKPRDAITFSKNFRPTAAIRVSEDDFIVGGSWGTIFKAPLIGSTLSSSVADQEFVGHENDVKDLAASTDGRFLLSGADKTAKLWNLKSRELLVTLFHGKDGEWVMWTPEGFFVASKNGGKLLGWQINQGPDKEARFVTAEQVRKLFNRPDLVTAKIEGGPENNRKVTEETERLDIDAILESGPPPEVAIVSPGDGWPAADNAVTVTVRVADKGGGIGRIAFRVNGQARNGEDDGGGGPAFGGMALNERGELTRRFQLARTDNVIEATATNGANFVESLPARLAVKVDERTLKGVPDLYVLAAGVDDYFDSALTLKYAVSDADAIGAAIEAAARSKAGGEFYRNVIVKRLRNGEVTRDKLDATFTEIGRQARATDVFVLFIAGHGKSEGNVYYFLPPDFKNVGLNPLQTQGISTDVWESWTARIQADKSLLIYDTCESGSLARGRDKVAARGLDEIAAYEALKRSTGRVTLSASAATDIALEGYRSKHGILTYAILEAIAQGDSDNRKQLSVFGLIKYLTDRVPQLSCEMTPPGAGRQSCYRQVPKASMNDLSASFPLLPRYAAANPDAGADAAATGAGAIGMPAPVERTHFLKTPMNLLDTPGGKVLRVLPARFGVGKIRVENGFALLARDGKTIGYVPEDVLEELQ